jgi:hypothetical protein
MTYIFLGCLVLLGLFAAFANFRRLDPAIQKKALRWLIGGVGAALAILLLLARRFDLALFAGAGAVAVLRTGRLGPFSLDGLTSGPSNVSKVQSYRFAMELDHDTGEVTGRVLNGQFAGMDLLDIGENDTRILLAEVEGDADSLSLLESWLDANRVGWREYFAEQDAGQHRSDSSAADPLAEAYELLGLKPGATEEDVRAAHRALMKAVHPDHGGTSYLAAKINEARDLLLRQSG